MPAVDFGNFVLTLDGKAHVAGELDGFADYNDWDNTYEFYILIPIDAQDANKTFDFELICPDNTTYNLRNATVKDSIDESWSPLVNFVFNNGTIKGTVTADGKILPICFNVKF